MTTSATSHRRFAFAATALFGLIATAPGCGEDSSGSTAAGGDPATGGRAEQGGSGGTTPARGGSGGSAPGSAGAAGSDAGASTAGSADGGAAQGGSAEGGSAEGGSAEGGSAEGGSAEGGSAGSNAEGGSAEGGGSASGGSAGSGDGGGDAGGADGGSGGGASASDELCGERPGGTLYATHVLRFESADGEVVVQLRRTWVNFGVGESSEFELDAMGIRLGETTTCITDPTALMYENTHHNWLDVARGTSDGIRYEAHVQFEPAAGAPPYLVAFDADENVFYPETALITTGRPAFCSACPGSVSLPLGISEIMIENVSTLADEEGEYEPWVELFNVTSEGVDLTGWTLSDDFGERDKWALPSITVAPGQLLVLFADAQPEQGELHASFRLSPSGGDLVLTAPDGVTDGGFVYAAPAADNSLAFDWATGEFSESLPTPGVGPEE